MSELNDEALAAMSLTQKITGITKEIAAVPKTKKDNSGVNYAFRGIDDVMDALNPMLVRYCVTQCIRVLEYKLERFVTEKEKNGKKYNQTSYVATVKIALVFSDGKGEEITEEVAMSEDYSDKAYTQAMSMAFKYAITRKFCIKTADTIEPDNSNKPADEPDAKAANNKPAANKPVAAPKAKKTIEEMDGNEFSKAWANLMAKLPSGLISMEQIEAVYILNEDQRTKLKALEKKKP